MKVKEMKRIIINECDENFIEFIRNNFENKKELSISEYRNNLNTLKKLDTDTLITGVARVEVIENHFSSIKSLSFIFALIAAIVAYYSDLSKKMFGDNWLSNALPLCITIVIFGYTCHLFVKGRNEMLTGVFFKNLLFHARELKK